MAYPEAIPQFGLLAEQVDQVGHRKGAGRKPMGKERYTVTLTAKNVDAARKLEANFSGLLDRLLARWLR